jgi:hypothetical protein
MVSTPGRRAVAAASALLATFLLGAAAPLREGERLALDDPRLANSLPSAVHAARGALLGSDATIEIGPPARRFAPALPFLIATGRFASGVRLRDGAMLESYVSGQPFPAEAVDCTNDPDAGSKLAWNAALAWEGDGADGRFRIRWEDQGETLGEPVEGAFAKVWLSHRVEPQLLEEQAGHLFRGERRSFATVVEVVAPFLDRGIRIVEYRYQPEAPSWVRTADDVWVYAPLQRRVRRWSDRPPTLALPWTPIVPEDHASYWPWPGAARWRCVGEASVLAPLARPAAPTGVDPPGGWEDLRFETRRVWVLEQVPNAPDPAAARRIVHLDRETMRPFYAVTLGADGARLRVTLHAWSWSGDDPARDAGWDGVPAVRALLPHRTLIARVDTGSRKRIDYLDVHAEPIGSAGRIRRLIDPSPIRCVAAETPIATPFGPRAVETLRVGDAVWSWDRRRAVRVAARIASIETAVAEETLLFRDSLRVTPEHPLLASGAWIPAAQVEASASLRHFDGSFVPAGVPETIAGAVRVYDLEIDGPANFFAGGVLVHNKSR